MSTPNFSENNQRSNQIDNNFKNYQSTLNSNPNNSQGNMGGSFGSNIQNTFANNYAGNNNFNSSNSTLQGPFQVLDKAVKNSEIIQNNRFDMPTSPKSKIGGFDNRSERFRPQDDQLSNFNRSIVGQP